MAVVGPAAGHRLGRRRRRGGLHHGGDQRPGNRRRAANPVENRDTSTLHNEVAIFDGGPHRVVAIVDAAKRGSVWMGVNDAGFCIENSLSNDLRDSDDSGPGNGQLMKLALETCQTIDDFERLLRRTNASGRSTRANFGVLDAQGGAALFETRGKDYVKFDANDPAAAPDGYIVRSNFAATANDLPADPATEAVSPDLYSGERYCRAKVLLGQRVGGGISVDYVLRNLCRDMADPAGTAYPGSINAPGGLLPELIDTSTTISRTTTVSAVVIGGVRAGEDPSLTTMWSILGDPKYSIAVPCWVDVNHVADPLEDPAGGELGEIAVSLRDWSLNAEKTAVLTRPLPGIWKDIWPTEDRIYVETNEALNRWRQTGPDATQLQDLHDRLAHVAMTAMSRELVELKADAIDAPPVSSPPDFGAQPLRVAVVDVGEAESKGFRNLSGVMSDAAAYRVDRLSPADVRGGALADHDLVILPGGSGSGQAEALQPEGCQAIRQFVQSGGGYVGICAGSYLASTQYDWSLGLINARVWDRAHWARGQGEVTLSLTDPGREVLKSSDATVEIHYGQGPLLVPGRDADLPAYEVLATYATEIAAKGAPAGSMVGTHAIIRSTYGDGRVICFSPHAEAEAGPGDLILSAVRWAGGDVAEADKTAGP